MERLWAPWRMEYIESGDKKDTCILCDKLEEKDGTGNLVLKRSEYSFVIMNKFPYNPGHLMVCPLRHIANVEELTPEEMSDLFQQIQVSVKVIKRVLAPHGYNLGLNAGRVAGAGVDQHLHFHIVPRWNGDTNFMPVLADVKVIPEHLMRTYKKLKAAFQELS